VPLGFIGAIRQFSRLDVRWVICHLDRFRPQVGSERHGRS
jgi:hypothetical protein